MGPAHRAGFRGVARHAHMLLLRQAPAVKLVFLHGGDDEAAVRRPHDVEVRSFPFEKIRLRVGVGKPERGAVVVGDGETVAFRRKDEAAHGGGRRPLLHAALAVARLHRFSGRPGDRAVRAAGDSVDPFPLFVAERFDFAARRCRDDAPVIAAGDQAAAVRRADQRARIRMRDSLADGAVLIEQQDSAVDEGERRRPAEKRRAKDMGAGVDGRDILAERFRRARGREGRHATDFIFSGRSRQVLPLPGSGERAAKRCNEGRRPLRFSETTGAGALPVARVATPRCAVTPPWREIPSRSRRGRDCGR